MWQRYVETMKKRFQIEGMIVFISVGCDYFDYSEAAFCVGRATKIDVRASVLPAAVALPLKASLSKEAHRPPANLSYD